MTKRKASGKIKKRQNSCHEELAHQDICDRRLTCVRWEFFFNKNIPVLQVLFFRRLHRGLYCTGFVDVERVRYHLSPWEQKVSIRSK